MVEQRTENPRVASSILALGTTIWKKFFAGASCRHFNPGPRHRGKSIFAKICCDGAWPNG